MLSSRLSRHSRGEQAGARQAAEAGARTAQRDGMRAEAGPRATQGGVAGIPLNGAGAPWARFLFAQDFNPGSPASPAASC